MSKEYDAYIKASRDWSRAMRFAQKIADKIEETNEKMARGVPPKEMSKYIKVIAKLNTDLAKAGKKEMELHKKMVKLSEALS